MISQVFSQYDWQKVNRFIIQVTWHFVIVKVTRFNSPYLNWPVLRVKMTIYLILQLDPRPVRHGLTENGLTDCAQKGSAYYLRIPINKHGEGTVKLSSSRSLNLTHMHMANRIPALSEYFYNYSKLGIFDEKICIRYCVKKCIPKDLIIHNWIKMYFSKIFTSYCKGWVIIWEFR